MKYINNFWFLVMVIYGFGAAGPVLQALAAEDQQMSQTGSTDVAAEPGEKSVQFETEGDAYLGFRWLTTDDSLKAAEFTYPHSSVNFGINLISCPLPWRYHINAEFASKYDFYSDAGFAYQDTILFRDILVGVHHNLDHYPYDYPGEPPGLIYTDRSTAQENYLDFLSNLATLRLKTPDFPFHTFINHRHVEREGKIQQRFMLGYFDDLNLVSESRNINWESNAIKIGGNSHLGPVEIEYAYDKAKFDPQANSILYDTYPAVEDYSRPRDIFPHNVIPRTESSAHSIRMHSSYTGSVVAAASLSRLKQNNNYSLTESTIWKGAFDFSWIPHPIISFFFKYRHRDVEMDNPDVVTVYGRDNTLVYPVRPGISYDKDTFSLSSRYKPVSNLSFFATYEYNLLERQNIAEWELLFPRAEIHSINLKALAKPFDQLTLKALYEFKNYDKPSYNSTPEKSNKLRLTTNYIPSPTINIYLQYLFYLSENDSLRYLNSEPEELLETGERDGERQQFLASLTKGITPKLSLTLSWFYQRWKIEQDLAYGKWSQVNIGQGDYPFFDFGVPYTDRSNSFSLAFNWMMLEDLTLAGDITHTIAKGSSEHTDVVGGADFTIGEFSNLEVAETTYSLSLTKRFSEKWEGRLKSYLNIFDDRSHGRLDGNLVYATFTLKRYF